LKEASHLWHLREVCEVDQLQLNVWLASFPFLLFVSVEVAQVVAVGDEGPEKKNVKKDFSSGLVNYLYLSDVLL